MDKKQLQEVSSLVSQDVVKMLATSGSGHAAGALGLVDIFVTLYFKLLHHYPKNPWHEERDRVIVSNGHICPVWYATLGRSGYFPIDEFHKLRRLKSGLQGHPHYRSLVGVENTSGPLGQGVSWSLGVALSAKLKKQSWKTICVTSDGEQQEGQVWEAYLAASKYELNNLIFILDRNQIQIGGNTEKIMPLEPLVAKLESFGLFVLEIDGHDFEQIEDAYYKALTISKKPVMILAHTIPGKGISFMERDYRWHGKVPNSDEMKRALIELQIKDN